MRTASRLASTLLVISLCILPVYPVSMALAQGIPVSSSQPAATPTAQEPFAGDSTVRETTGNDDQDAGIEADGTEESLTCGVERWAVKTGTDADSGLVSLAQVTPTIIPTLTALAAPATLPASNRVAPTETTVFQLTCTLVEFKAETDNDYHLVLSDGAGHTMIAEIPNPGCVGASSPFLSAITSARSQFDAKYTATSSFKTVNVPVQVTGVGFFDFLHGQTGVAPNGIELHPVLNIVFNPSTSADFSLSASPMSLSVAQGGTGNVTLTSSLSGSFSSAVSFSASGLPSGVTASFSPATISAPGSGSTTLTLTVSSTAATSSAPITITATGGGKTHTANVSLTVTAPGGGGSGILNGGFESGITSWTAGGVVAPTASTAVVHTGASSAYVTGGSTAGDSTLYQTVAVPTTGGTLSFWYYPISADTITYDWQEVDICNTSGTVLATPLKVCSNTKTWTNVSYNMATYAGTSVRILFKVHDDAYPGYPSSMYVDDVAISGTTPPATYTISGTVSGAATSGVTMSLTGAATATTTTGTGGTYTFSGPGQRQLHGDAEPERLHVQPHQHRGDHQQRQPYGHELHGHGGDDHLQHLGHGERRGDVRRDDDPERRGDGTTTTATGGTYTFSGTGQRQLHGDAEPERLYVQPHEYRRDDQRRQRDGELHGHGGER